jgi:hypothetical protein
MPKLYSFHTVIYSCSCDSCDKVDPDDMFSDAELADDSDGMFVEGIDMVQHCKVIVRYTHDIKSALIAFQELRDNLRTLECDGNSTLPVLDQFCAHVSKNLGSR